MNINKKGKLVTLLTVAIMCVAIVAAACLIFVPNKRDDLEVTPTAADPYSNYDSGAYGGYGMSKEMTFDKNNMALVLAKENSDDHVWIYFPTEIYMDVTEDLATLGYFYRMYFHYGGSGNSDNHQMLFHSAMGLYPESDITWQGQSNRNNNKAKVNGQYPNTNMRKFFDNYVPTPEVPLGAQKNLRLGENWGWSEDSQDYHTTYMEGAHYDSNQQGIVNVTMSGKGKLTENGKYQRYAGTPIFGTRHYNFWSNPQIQLQWILTNTESASTARSYGYKPAVYSTDMPVLDDISININIYDKSGLLSAMQKLDKQYTAVKSYMSSTEQSKFENFRDNEVKPLLSKRKTTQSEINTMKSRVENYYFTLEVAMPRTGSQNAPLENDYIGSAYTVSSVWSDFNKDLNGLGNYVSKYLLTPTVKYGVSSFGSSLNPDGLNMTNAGYYSIVLKPSPDIGYFLAGGDAGNTKVKLTWQGGGTGDVTIWYKINKAPLTVSIAQSIERDYNGKSPITIHGLENPQYTMTAPEKNPIQLLLSDEPRGSLWGSWQDQGLTDSIDVSGIGVHKIYYIVNAPNHVDATGSFNVNVVPADIEVRLKQHQVTYGADLLTSEEIFTNLLADETPNILDATSREETVAYLKEFISFQVIGSDNAVMPEGSIPGAGSYNIHAQKTAEGSEKIANINFGGTDANAYVVLPKSITVDWTDNANMWYDGARGHRPTAEIKDTSQLAAGDSKDNVVLSAIGVGEGKMLDSDDPVALVNGNAVNAGRYVATVSSTNGNYVISNNTHEFSILRRKISIDICDRTRRYAFKVTADEVVEEYKNDTLLNNTNGSAYTATLDADIASNSAVSNKNALVDTYSAVFDVNIIAQRTSDNKYFIVGDHTLQFVNKNNPNYEITSGSDGVFHVTPAQIEASTGSTPVKTYNGDLQDITLAKNSEVITVYGYEKEHMDTAVTIQYSEVSIDGPWSDVKIKDVSESGKRIYYKITADNHLPKTGSFIQEMRPASILITIGGQNTTVYYGDVKYESADITTICDITFKVENRDLHPSQIFEFYLLDAKTSLPVTSRKAVAGDYTIQHRIRAEVNEKEDNFSVNYLNEANNNAYKVSKRLLHVDWQQNGDRWQGAGKDQYVFSNSNPTVFPTAPSTFNGVENVVEGDSIYFKSIELEGKNVGSYTVSTDLTTQINRDRYEIVESEKSHTFKIVKLDINIIVDDQTAVYGKAKDVPIGALVDPVSNPTAIWDYAENSATFYGDHFRNYKFVTDAHGNGLVDVGSYDIALADNDGEGMDGSVRQNYNVQIVNFPKFTITQANIRYTGRQFNIDYDSDEAKTIKIGDLISRVTVGVEGVGLDSFTIRMSNKFFQSDNLNYDDASLQWVNETTDTGIGKYYVWFEVTGNKNFVEFRHKIELNILTDWISVRVGEGITNAEYGYAVYTSEQIFEKIDIEFINGFMGGENGDRNLWDVAPEAAKAKLMQYIEFFVGKGDLETEMKTNESIGYYTLFMRGVDGAPTDFENFRFIPRVGETDTSNIDAYRVLPRTIYVNWTGLDEEYGSHGNSHTGFELIGVLPDDVNNVRLELTYGAMAETGASFVGGHAHTVGTYTAYANSIIGSSNYTLDPDDENRSTTFEISPKRLEIELHSREFIYGVQNASVAEINNALNVYSQTPNYDVTDASKSPFVGNDKRTDIFEIFFKSNKTLPSNFKYLPVSGDGQGYSYSISARLADTDVARNYQIILVVDGTLTIKPARLAFTTNELPRKYFNAREQVVDFNSDWIVAGGDVEYVKNNVSVSYKVLSREDVREDNPEFIPGDKFTVKDAGKYEIKLRIEAPNHETFETGIVTLFVDRANVTIKMDQVSKEYGQQLGDFTLSSLSDWIKHNANISIVSFRIYNGERIEEDITRYAIDDFIFYVVDPNNMTEENPELPIGSYQNNVGTYRIFHKFNTDNNALAYNYLPDYYQAPGAESKCNAHAYKINPKKVEVKWMTDDRDNNWKTRTDSMPEYYYNNGTRPTLMARFATLDGTYVELDITGNGGPDYNANEEGMYYQAHAAHSSMGENNYSLNYELTNTSCNYRIVPRPVTVEIKNQNGGSYGASRGSHSIVQGEINVIDGVLGGEITLKGNPILLTLNGATVSDNEFLPAGRYKITASFVGSNYDPTYVNAEDSSKDCGYYIITPAKMSLSLPLKYTGLKYLGSQGVFNFKDVVAKNYINANTFADDDDAAVWESAKITIYQDGVQVDAPYYDKAGSVTFRYVVEAANHMAEDGEWTFDVAKGQAYLSFFDGAHSIYGDNIYEDADALSKRIVQEAKIAYLNAQGCDVLSLPIEELGRFYVLNNPTDAGTYDIAFELYQEHADNFEIHEDSAHGMGSKYVILPKELKVIWTLDSNDSYVYNFQQHFISARLDGVLEEDVDTITAAYASISGRDAGKYTAKLTGIGTNKNYKMPADDESRTFVWEITPRPITVSWNIGEYVYNGVSQAPTVTYESGLIQGDTYGKLVVEGAVNAGTQTAFVTTTSKNYTVANNEQTFVIAPKPVYVTWKNMQFEYDGEQKAPTAKVNKEDLIGDIECNAVVGGGQKNAGKHTATVASLSDTNYIVVNNTAEFEIMPKEVKIYWSNTDLSYNGSEQAPNAIIEGLIKGDDVEVIVTGKGVNANSSYKATATGLSNPNYVISTTSSKTIEYTISKSRNEFIEMPAIGGDLKELPWTDDASKPKAKFGETVVKYYTDEACTKEYKGDLKKAKEGTYWVKAYVEGNDNYDAVESAVIMINLEKGFNKAAAATLITLSAVMLAAVLVLTLVINSKKKKGGRA